MNKTSKLLAIATLVVAVMIPAVSAQETETENEARPKAKAQRGERGPGGGRPNIEEMTKALGLDEAQKEKIGAVMRDSREKMRTLREDTSLAEDDRRAKVRSIMETSRAGIEAVLTPEQRTKFSEMQNRNRRGLGKGEGRPRKDAK